MTLTKSGPAVSNTREWYADIRPPPGKRRSPEQQSSGQFLTQLRRRCSCPNLPKPCRKNKTEDCKSLWGELAEEAG
jgi:hypothetical protein